MTTHFARIPYFRLRTGDTAIDIEFGKLQQNLQGVFKPKVIRFAQSPYTVLTSDWLLLVDCTGGAVSLVFDPLPARMEGLYVMVVKTDASANAVTLTGTFNGVVNPTLAVRYQSKTINAGNGSYYFVPTLTAADILSGTFPGNYVIAGTLEVDGNFSVNTNKFTVTASNGNTAVSGTLDSAGNFSVATSKFTVAASSGNTVAAGTLSATGNFAVNTNKFTVTASSGNFSSAGSATIAALVDISGASAGQIKFPATQNTSANANTLDDYEEGTWTPSLGGTATYTLQSGSYVKIGRLVFVQASLAVNALGTGSTTFISGLPFAEGTGLAAAGGMSYFAGLASGNVVYLSPQVNGSATDISFNSLAAASSTVTQNAAIFGAGARVDFALFYQTST